MNEEALFEEALSRSPEERAAFLEQACAGRAELLAAVGALLAAHEKSDNILDRPQIDLAQTLASGPGQARPDATLDHTPGPDDASSAVTKTTDYQPKSEAGTVIARRYTLQEKIGEGGMGEVWVAKQTEPVKRKVALKLIKTGMDSKAVLQRFEQERQALAMMDHPNIARVLDGGLTPTGQPFFVMEVVNGLPLTKFCDEARLTTKERLELFVPICQAVQHAHQKGIVHRDLKPANILVTIIDGKGVPKVIDFGVAKATAGKLTDESMSTQFGAVIGTLEYMSPEQTGFSGVDIDTRADIYSLGVILYELLTGLRPIDANRLKKAAITEMIRIIQEEEPSKPSTRLSTDNSLPSMAALRQIEPRKLMALLRGELDCVVMKCLEKQRERRYETANALARDIQRYLADEAVEARPQSAGYRFSKFLRRNKGSVIAASLVFLALLAGITGTTLGLFRAEAQRQIAEAAKKAEAEQRAQAVVERDKAIEAGRRAENSREEAIAAGQRAEANAATARRAVNDYLDRVTTSPQLQRPGLSGLRRDLLTRALSYYENFLRESTADPELRAEAANAQNRAAMILSELGETSKAVEAGQRAVALNEQLIHDQPDKPAYRHRLAAALNTLGNALRVTRRSDEALATFRRSAEIREALLRTEPDNVACATDLAVSWGNLAKTMGNMGRVPESEALLVRLRTHLEELIQRAPDSGSARELLADALHSLGNLAADRQQFEEARSLYQRSLELREAIVREHPDDWAGQTKLARINNELGLLHFHFNRPEEALPYYEKSRELRERLLAAEPASAELQEYLARSLENLGNLQNSFTNYSAALPVLERARELRARLAAASRGNAEMQGALGGSLHNLAMSHEGLGHNAEAERLYRDAIETQQRARALQPEIVVYRVFLTNHLLGLGGIHLRAGKADEAAKLALEAAALWTTQPQPQPLLRSAMLLASCVGAIGAKDFPGAKAQQERFGRSAVEILDKAAALGFRNVDFFRSSKELDPIRERGDFKGLIRRLESNSAPSN